MKPILFLALDVDDNAFHGCGICSSTNKEYSFSCRPTLSALLQKLKKFTELNFDLKICYEATYLGFSLYRDLIQNGYACEVIDPGQIPRAPGPRVKTDRLDSRKMAELFVKGMLTSVYVPNIDDEAERDLVRARRFLVEQNKSLKNYILNICRRLGLDYRREIDNQSADYFSLRHREWLDSKVHHLPDGALKSNLKYLLTAFRQNESVIGSYDEEIERISEFPKYQKRVAALTCYRGIKLNSAMTLITEIGDISRFSHPNKLASYLGLDISEYSSGGKERKFGITKMGNRFARTALVESCQSAAWKPTVSRWLQLRRTKSKPEHIEIANRCMKRLHKKSAKLLAREKHKNKVKVACAREMAGFVWESLRAVA